MRVLVVLLLLSFGAFAQGEFLESTTSASKVKMTFSNYGTWGNAFRGYRNGAGIPSCAYPDSIAIEHINEGGIWIGGIREGSPYVSTSSVDAAQGLVLGETGFEFTPDSVATINESSNIVGSDSYDSSAIAVQQFQYRMTDRNTSIPSAGTPIPEHTPLGIDMETRILNFRVEENHSILYVELSIINHPLSLGPNRIDSLYVVVYLNAVIRNINVTPPRSGGVLFFSKGANGFLTDRYAAYSYDYSGDVGRTNTYIAQKILGIEDKLGVHHPEFDTSYSIHYNAWEYNISGNGVFDSPADDLLKYQKLLNGIQDDDCWTDDGGDCGLVGSYSEQLNSEGNRADLVSIGPVRDFERGDTVKFTFAFVFANKLDDGRPYVENTKAQMTELINRLDFAQSLYNGEDVNFNGVLDSGEDKDGNGKISRYYFTPVGIQENKQLEKLKFENPNNGHFLLDFSNQQEKISQIEIFSPSGQLVFSKILKSERYISIDLSDLRSGTYFLRVTSKSYQQRVEKLIKI